MPEPCPDWSRHAVSHEATNRVVCVSRACVCVCVSTCLRHGVARGRAGPRRGAHARRPRGARADHLHQHGARRRRRVRLRGGWPVVPPVHTHEAAGRCPVHTRRRAKPVTRGRRTGGAKGGERRRKRGTPPWPGNTRTVGPEEERERAPCRREERREGGSRRRRGNRSAGVGAVRARPSLDAPSRGLGGAAVAVAPDTPRVAALTGEARRSRREEGTPREQTTQEGGETPRAQTTQPAVHHRATMGRGGGGRDLF